MIFSALALRNRERLDEGGNLHAADDRVFLHVENFSSVSLPLLEIVANLSALDAGGLGLLELPDALRG